MSKSKIADAVRETVLSYNILNSSPEANFDNLTKLASTICNTPIALLSIVDDKQLWYKSKIGFQEKTYPIEESICQFTLQQKGILEIQNIAESELIQNDPKLSGQNLAFYAGKTLVAPNGHNIGTICVVDTVERTLTDEQRFALETISNEIIAQLELRKLSQSLKQELSESQLEKILLNEQLLNYKKQEWRHLFDAVSTTSVVAQLDTSGKFIQINSHFSTLFGYSENECIGKFHDELISSNSDNVKLQLEAILQGNIVSGRFMRVTKNNESVWLQSSYCPIRDEQNKISAILLIAYNITTEVSAEKKLLDSKRIAEEIASTKDEFIANMSHEIRTPMNAIMGFTELLTDTYLTEDQLSYVNAIQNAGEILLNIINDILDISKIESGNLHLEAIPFNPSTVVSKGIELLQPFAKDKKLDIIFNNNLSEIEVIGDKHRLSQVVYNIVNNAIKFTQKGNISINLDLIEENNQPILLFKVRDTGEGIPKEKLVTIFERFTQLEHHATKSKHGTGLGLNIVQKLISLQNGTIDVESELNVGTTFTIRIPYKRSESVVKKTIKSDQLSNKENSNYKLLLCEDNELNRMLAKKVIQQFGFQMDVVENGALGVEALRNQKYDLVIMDLQMPVMDGYEATRQIRNTLKLDLPILAMTAHSLVGEREKCLEVGMNEYIPKPFKQEELYAALIDLLKIETRTDSHNSETNQKSGNLDLSYLQQLSGGIIEFENEILQMFVDQTPEDFGLLKEAIKTNDIKRVGEIAHKMKSSTQIVGSAQCSELLESIELKAKANASVEELLPLVEQTELQLKEVMEEIKLLIESRV